MGESVYLARAVALAKKSLGRTRPNPAVGAVIVKGGKIVGEGRHKKAGGDHAETSAIKNAFSRGVKSLEGATIFVTLEPCSKVGRVGACTDAIASSGIKRVVYCVSDPNPKNRGKASRALKRFGISCESADKLAKRLGGEEKEKIELCIQEAKRIIAPFAKHVREHLPYVTVKLAMSLDGRICDLKGRAKWISSERSRRETGFMRSQVDAIMVGGETVRCDNPSLLCRQGRHDSLIRVVVSKSRALPASSQVFTDSASDRTLVFSDPEEALVKLGQMGITSVLCEGGLKLARSLHKLGLVDEWHTVLAPVVIGEESIAEAKRFKRGSCGISDPASGDVHARAYNGDVPFL